METQVQIYVFQLNEPVRKVPIKTPICQITNGEAFKYERKLRIGPRTKHFHSDYLIKDKFMDGDIGRHLFDKTKNPYEQHVSDAIIIIGDFVYKPMSASIVS